jgi:hypothetical protein
MRRNGLDQDFAFHLTVVGKGKALTRISYT